MSVKCKECGHYVPTRNGVGKCLHLEMCAAFGIVDRGSTTICNITVERDGEHERCNDWREVSPREVMEFIIDNDREEQRWNP